MNGHAQISFVESSAESNIEHVFVNPELMGGEFPFLILTTMDWKIFILPEVLMKINYIRTWAMEPLRK
jgi:hypothetical protein